MAKKAPRSWGYWTEGKLDILARYLDRFTTTTKYKADARIYLDAFAGEGLGTRYHLKLWIGVLDESAAYLPA